MKSKRTFFFYITLLFILFLGTGCSINMSHSADEIITNMLDSNSAAEEYYAEGKMTVYEKEQILEDVIFQEHVSADGNRKIIMEDQLQPYEYITVRNDGEIISYDSSTQTAIVIDIADLELPQALTQTDQVTMLLESTKESHDHELIGEEKINGFDTYHMKLTAKNSSSILGDIEIWVDQKSWFMVKTKTVSGDTISESLYTKMDFSPTFSEDTFAIQLPDDVKIESIDDLMETETGTLADAEKAIGGSFFIISEDDAQLQEIEIFRSNERNEVSLNYFVGEQPGFFLSVFPTPAEEELQIIDGEWTIRGLDAEYEKMGNMDFLLWDEDGLRYSLVIENPELSVEEVTDMTERMVLSSESR